MSETAWQDQYEAACHEAREYIWRLADERGIVPIEIADGVFLVATTT